MKIELSKAKDYVLFYDEKMEKWTIVSQDLQEKYYAENILFREEKN